MPNIQSPTIDNKPIGPRSHLLKPPLPLSSPPSPSPIPPLSTHPSRDGRVIRTERRAVLRPPTSNLCRVPSTGFRAHCSTAAAQVNKIQSTTRPRHHVALPKHHRCAREFCARRQAINQHAPFPASNRSAQCESNWPIDKSTSTLLSGFYANKEFAVAAPLQCWFLNWELVFSRTSTDRGFLAPLGSSCSRPTPTESSRFIFGQLGNYAKAPSATTHLACTSLCASAETKCPVLSSHCLFSRRQLPHRSSVGNIRRPIHLRHGTAPAIMRISSPREHRRHHHQPDAPLTDPALTTTFAPTPTLQ